MVRPRPKPLTSSPNSFVVKYGSKMRARRSGAIPVPSSTTWNRNPPFGRETAATRTSCPLVEASMALLTRLTRRRCSSTPSAIVVGVASSARARRTPRSEARAAVASRTRSRTLPNSTNSIRGLRLSAKNKASRTYSVMMRTERCAAA